MIKPAVIIVGAGQRWRRQDDGVTHAARLFHARAKVLDGPRIRYRNAEGHAQAVSSRHLTDVVDINHVPRSDEDFRHDQRTRASDDDRRPGGILLSTTHARVARHRLHRRGAASGQLTFAVFHILGPSIASLDEIADTSAYLSATRATSWSRTSPTTKRTSSSGIRRPTIPTSTEGQQRRRDHDPEAQRRWPPNRSSLAPRCRLPEFHRQQGPARRERRILFVRVAWLCAPFGSATSGPSSTASNLRKCSVPTRRPRWRCNGKARPLGRACLESGPELETSGPEVAHRGPRGMSRPSHVLIVCSSSRPRVGKTLPLARAMLAEFYRADARPVGAYDLSPYGRRGWSSFLPSYVRRSAPRSPRSRARWRCSTG